MAYYVGVDLGGTKIYTGLADAQGRILSEIKVPTAAENGYIAVIRRIASTIEEVCNQADVPVTEVSAIGVGAPGPLNSETGVVHLAPNLGWENAPLGSDLEKLLHLPVLVDNDANLAALGEHRFGAGRGASDLVFITVSTGIGGGLILNNSLYRGAGFAAGEIGHTVVDPDGPPCSCGSRGCLETLASGSAIARQAQTLIASGGGRGILVRTAEAPDEVTAVTVFDAAAGGDAEALHLIQTAARYLGIGIANILNLLNPSLVVLGGGVMESGPLILDLVRGETRNYALKEAYASARLVPAELGERMGLMGALALAIGKPTGIGAT